MSDSLLLHGFYSPWNSPGQNTGEGSLSLLQGIFPTQGSNSGLQHCGQILYQLSQKILERVAYPFSRESSQPRNRTGVSCIAGGFFTNWSIREEWFKIKWNVFLSFPRERLSGKNPPANVGGAASILGLGRSSGGGNGNPLQYSYLENSMDRGTWRATVRGVSKESDMT